MEAWRAGATKEYKRLKVLKKENLRDNMTNVELALNTLAEASATEISKQRNPKGFKQHAEVAQNGGMVAKVAREQLEQQLGVRSFRLQRRVIICSLPKKRKRTHDF